MGGGGGEEGGRGVGSCMIERGNNSKATAQLMVWVEREGVCVK